MHTFLDAKTMAKALRQGLADRDIELNHSDCLELVARQFGLNDWNTLAARIEAANRPAPPLPDGWFISHANPAYYSIGLDPDERGSVCIASVPGAAIPPDYTGVLMQSISAAHYIGEKLRLTAELRGEHAHLGTIWMRVDPSQGKSLRFDNMMRRNPDGVLRGTFGWTARTIVLDIPENAASIHYGYLLQGTGKLWARNFRLDIADPDAQTTGSTPFPPRPINLDFTTPAQPHG